MNSITIVFFRSWDLFAGFPENLGGLQLLKEYVLAHLNFECKDGSIIAYSSGLHIYEQYFDLVNKLSINKVSVDANIARALENASREEPLFD